ncbi:hypothetical protein R2Q81_02595 [Microbacterium aquimaris]|uniref:MFS transporter n=1 Tax=Microbacterium aquimaris TaxID=459816 RepID=UPI002AD59AA4|nr:MFS transporter [Microbacterium aquimaris]MDZ8274829.1 hypothetical protein [Microbacterium aquimaris]
MTTSRPVARILGFGGAVIATSLAAAAAPTPLYHHYAAAWGGRFSDGAFAYALYAGTVLLAIACAGIFVDRVGVRKVVSAALGAQIVALLLLATASSFVIVDVARGLQGVATGLAIVPLGALMVESSYRWGAVISAAAPGLGTGVGALSAAAVVQAVAEPAAVVYLVFAPLVVVQLAMVRWAVPPDRVLPPTLGIAVPSFPTTGKGAFTVVALLLLGAWGLAGYLGSAWPMSSQEILSTSFVGIESVPLAATTITGAAAALALRRVRRASLSLLTSAALVTAGGVFWAGVTLANDVMIVGAAALAGLGFGGAMLTAAKAVRQCRAADVVPATAMTYLLCYGGMAFAALGAGFALDVGSDAREVAGAVLIAVTALAALAGGGALVLDRR